MKLKLFRINTPEFLKLPSTKRKESEAKRLKEEAYIKSEEARQERAARQRQQMEEHYEETRKRRERGSYLDANTQSFYRDGLLVSYAENKDNTVHFIEEEKPAYVGNDGEFSGGGSSSSWNSDSSYSYSSPDSCSSSSDNDNSSSSSSNSSSDSSSCSSSD